MFRARDPLLVLGQLLAAGAGTLVALAATGWPGGLTGGLVGLAGAFIGLLVALGVEHVLRLHIDVRRLRDAERQLEAERETRAEERRMWSYQLAVANARAQVAEAGTKVFGDAFNEAAAGHVLPLSAILARLQMEQKVRGVDKPLPPLDQWKGPPPGQPL